MAAEKKRKLMDQVMDTMRVKHYSPNTMKTYRYWILQYIRYHGKQHPAKLGKPEIEAYLSHLVKVHRLSASSQNQAFNAILFLYRHVLRIDLPGDINALRAWRRERIPVVLTQREAAALIGRMKGRDNLMVELLYGAGLRIGELLSLRIMHLDFESNRIHILDSKGKKDRFSVLPQKVVPVLSRHIIKVKALHDRDLAVGLGQVGLPHALYRKYKRASREFKWQFLFPARTLYRN
jgi:site-specific recombinase XerD